MRRGILLTLSSVLQTIPLAPVQCKNSTRIKPPTMSITKDTFKILWIVNSTEFNATLFAKHLLDRAASNQC